MGGYWWLGGCVVEFAAVGTVVFGQFSGFDVAEEVGALRTWYF